VSANKVLDAYALIAYLENEPGSEKVEQLIRQARDSGRPLLVCVVNWGEVYYNTLRESGKAAADRAIQQLDSLPLEVVPADRELTLAAAGIKAAQRMPYADCFAAALARTRKAALVTGDKEFKALEGSIPVVWL
jgi:ribonuclease VapC